MLNRPHSSNPSQFPVTMRTVVLVQYVLLNILLITPICTDASSPALATTSPEACAATSHPTSLEDQILNDASQLQQDTAAKTVSEDISVEHPEETRDAWQAAYDQWVLGKKRDLGERSKRSIELALNSASQPIGKDSDGPVIRTAEQLPEADDDELTVITQATHSLVNSSLEELQYSLNVVYELCSSIDNGRQFEAAGGVRHVIRLMDSMPDLKLLLLKVLAVCAQNNPAVFETAVREGAIDKVLDSIQDVDTAVRAAALRALRSLADADDSIEFFYKRREDIISLIATAARVDELGTEESRVLTRGFALMEILLIKDATRWSPILIDENIVASGKRMLQSENPDIREGAARVLKLLQS